MPEVDLQKGGQQQKLEDVVEQKSQLGQQIHVRQEVAGVVPHTQRAMTQRPFHLSTNENDSLYNVHVPGGHSFGKKKKKKKKQVIVLKTNVKIYW
jgi:hypothetical protein